MRKLIKHFVMSPTCTASYHLLNLSNVNENSDLGALVEEAIQILEKKTINICLNDGNSTIIRSSIYFLYSSFFSDACIAPAMAQT